MTKAREISTNGEHRDWPFLSLVCALAIPPVVNLLALPILFRCWRGVGVRFLIVSIAAIASFYIPIGDQNDYFNLVLKWGDSSYGFLDFLDDATIREINLIHISLYLLAKIGCNLEIYRAILITLSATICIAVAKSIAYHDKDDTNDEMGDIIFCAIFMTFPLFSVCTGFRYGLATIIYIWGIFFFERYGERKRLLLSMLISSFIHFSIVVFWFCYFIARLPFVRKFMLDKLRFVMILVFGFAFSFAMNFFFNLIEGGLGDGFIGHIFSIYLSSDAYYNEQFFEDVTSNSRLFYNIFASTLYVQVPFLLMNIDNIDKRNANMLSLLGLLIFLGVFTYSNVTLLNRLVILSSPIFAILIGDMIVANAGKGERLLRLGFVLFCAFICLFPIVRMKKAWFRSNVIEALYKPSILCFFNHYDEDWVKDNLDERALAE